MGIILKLFAVQQALKAPKNQLNKFGGYNYRSCEDILEALKPHLGLNQMVINLTDEVKEVGGRIYVVATAKVTDVETGESWSANGYAREEAEKKGMDTSQITGAASSYARKYALNGLFAIDDNRDSDATNTSGKNLAKNAPDGSYYCEECNEAITKQKIGGVVYEPNQIANRGIEKHGKQLCWSCQKKHEMPTG